MNSFFKSILVVFCFTMIACKFSTDQKEGGKQFSGPIEAYFDDKYGEIDEQDIRRYMATMEKEASKWISNTRSSGSWVVQGPGNLGGRVNAIAVNPANQNEVYIGFSQGGLFKTNNGGSIWEPIFDQNSYLSIGDITIDPNNSNHVYVGTGDPQISGYPAIGNGLFRSKDGGKNWESLGLESTRVISEVYVAKNLPKTIYVSAMGLPFKKTNDRGLYRSKDGGQSWKQVLFVNDSTGITDIAVDPRNENVVYAASWTRLRNNQRSLISSTEANIYKTVDGGETWVELTNGLPSNDAWSRLAIELAPSNPDILYTSYVSPSSLNVERMFKSSNAGATWDEMPIGNSTGLDPSFTGGFGWYFGRIAVDPNDHKHLFVLGVILMESFDGGLNWARTAQNAHVDNHEIVFSGNKIFLGCDGGAYRYSSETNIWSDIENIPTNQIYRVGLNPHSPEVFYGGLQDNGTCFGNSQSLEIWEEVFGGDGFQSLFDADDENIYYFETQNGGLWWTNDGGLSFDSFTKGIENNEPKAWDMPIVMSQQTSKTLVTGTNRVYIIKDPVNGVWEPISQKLTSETSVAVRKVITAIAVHPANDRKILAGTSDGQLWLTTDQGNSWKNVTASLPNRYITSVAFGLHENEAIYVTFSGFRDGDDSPYLFYSNNNGTTWRSIGDDLPAASINKVLVLPHLSDIVGDIIIVGTDAGVYFGQFSPLTTSFSRLGDNMPIVPVYDLAYSKVNNNLVAGTFGRSIQTYNLDQIGYYVGNKDLALLGMSLRSTIVQTELELIINSKEIDSYSTTIYTSSGQFVSHQQMQNGSKVNVADLATGVYFLQLKGKKGVTSTVKFVKV